MRRAAGTVVSPALASWVAARVAVLGALGLSRFITSELGARATGGRTASGLLGWDASWYEQITAVGYAGLPSEAVRFFPLLPLLAKVPDLVLPSGIAVLVVANVASLVAAVLLERLVRTETGDAGLAARSVWFLALFPSAFVLVMGYAESLFLVAVIGGMLALRTQRWWWAAAAGLAAGLSRPLGVVFALPALIEVLRDRKGTTPREVAARLAAVAAPFLGAGLYLAWVGWRLGDALLPVQVQQEAGRRGGFVDPVSRLIDAGGALASGDELGSGLHLPWALLFLALVAVCLRRWPVSYGAFAGALVLVALSASNLDSLERYGLSAFPLVLAVASFTRHPSVERIALTGAAATMVSYATLAFLGAYVP